MKIPNREDFIDGKNLSALKWAGASLDAVEFKDVVFENCDFAESLICDCHFDSCKFIDCNLEMAKLSGSNFSDVEFVKCRLRGIAWEAVGLSFYDVLFSESDLDYSSFYGRRLDDKVVFENCSLRESSFESCSIKDGKITGCDLADARFTDALLIRTDFSQSHSYSIDIASSNVRAAIFSLPEAICLFDQFNVLVR